MLDYTKTQKGLFVVGFAAAVLNVQGEEKKVEALEPTTVLASRFEQNLGDVSSAVTVLEADALRYEGIRSLQEAIGYRVPGAFATSTAGQKGQGGSLFLRGTSTDQTQIRVDGVRLTDSNTIPSNLLGSGSLLGLSQVEVLRGPQSALYGGEAIGGVVGLYSRKGSGAPSGALYGEFGSFGSWLGQLGAEGRVGDFSYNLQLQGETTENDREFNDFEQFSYALRLDWDLSATSSIGMTVRGVDARYETPEEAYENGFVSPAQESHRDSILTTFFFESAVNEKWYTKATLGFFDQAFDVDNGFFSDSEKLSAYWDNQYSWNDRHVTRGGLVYEQVGFDDGGVDETRDIYGLYLNHDWEVSDCLRLHGGARWEDHDDYGDEVTWSAGAVYEVYDGWKLKANGGKGFRTPNFVELAGIPSFGIGPNAGLVAERSLGWDFGVEKEFSAGRVRVSWFENDVEDLIVLKSDFSSYENRAGKSKANGIEAEGTWRADAIRTEFRVAYTYLQNSLDGLPEQVVTVGAATKLTDDLEVGLNGSWIDQRTYGSAVELDDFLLVGLHANLKVSENVTLHGRVENLLDESYELANFGTSIPGRGLGAFVGATVKF